MTDLVVIIVLLINFAFGWMKGFLRSLIGPLALVGCIYFSLDYFEKTQNAAAAIAIGVFGPIALSIFAGLFIRICLGGVKPGSPSRLAGGMLNALWVGAMLFISLALVMIIPLQWKPAKTVQADIRQSMTFTLISPWIQDYLPKERPPVSYGPAQTQQQKIETMQSSEEYRDLMAQPQVQALFEDEETLRAIKEKDIGALMKNPRFMELMTDRQMMQKFLQFYRNVPMEGIGLPEDAIPEVACVYNSACSDLDCGRYEGGGDEFEGLCLEGVCQCVKR